MVAGGMVKMSSESTVMSASLPGSMLPRSASRPTERAPQMVHIRSASSTEMASSGCTTPKSLIRVTAVFMARKGFTACK